LCLLRDDQKSELVELDIPETSKVIGKQVVQIGLPLNARIVPIHRNEKYITASGETVIEGKDHLLVMGDNKDTVSEVFKAFGLKA
jgi:cell volume regulation protein A